RSSEERAKMPAPAVKSSGSHDEKFEGLPVARHQIAPASEEEVDKMVQEDLKVWNVPIRFWGRVVDQNGEAVQGAMVKRFARQWTGFGKADFSIIAKLTDAEGGFVIDGVSGDSVSIESIEKKGYVLSNKALMNFSFGGPVNPASVHRPDPGRPVMFKMWKKGEAQPLIVQSKSIRIPYDGTPVLLDLTRGRQVTAEGQADIRIKLARTPLEIKRGQQKFDWVVQIDALDGGLIHSMEEFMNTAPETGYERGLEIQMLATDPEWRSNLSVPLYLQIKGGKQFGRLRLNFRTDSDQPKTGFNFETYINPTGSRNLEYDPAKRINR
ncbi:MAG: carboxypeptidase-like regulatory domain-containing protein, partial [Anaerolineae bacterium]|nr:carboxypeptidase-like regulatory domain-containing protein [Anaerolineae bacterium]